MPLRALPSDQTCWTNCFYVKFRVVPFPMVLNHIRGYCRDETSRLVGPKNLPLLFGAVTILLTSDGSHTPRPSGYFTIQRRRGSHARNPSLGPPQATVKQEKLTCDSYKLYTRGPGTAGKVAIATTEVVADVFTLGLTELATTPAEYATRNSLHTVLMCYDSDGSWSRTSSLLIPPGYETMVQPTHRSRTVTLGVGWAVMAATVVALALTGCQSK